MAVVAALTLGAGSAAFGDDVDDKIKASKSEIDDLSKELTAADAKLKKTDAAVAAAHKKVTTARSKLTSAQLDRKSVV